ncbi:hypothetical protein KXQ82_01350 [Mucilaginibacter sp. HMF5004]|nr:hypothetical protein [Mucilaginibacter rivuli]MBW4888335.1 hypothetical protein [Mucilaginibacter rivuli]
MEEKIHDKQFEKTAEVREAWHKPQIIVLGAKDNTLGLPTTGDDGHSDGT